MRSPDAHELEDALERGLLELHYQPIVSLADRRVVGLEALCRWRHPARGWVPPGEFIPVAEASGLIVALGGHVLAEVARQAAAWRESHPSALPLAVFANVSPFQLRRPDFATRLADLRERHGLTAAELGIEVTPTAPLDDRTSGQNLATVAAAGTPFAMDDFGRGFASVSQAQQYPFSILKLDRAYLQSPGHAIAAAVATLGGALGMETIPEGIETEAQARGVQDLGCTVGQGYLFGRPKPAAEISALLVR